jgi:peptide deformylase
VIKVTDYIVQENMAEEFDKSILHVPLFPVNMRLFASSEPFRQLIFKVAEYMDWKLKQKPTDYTQPRGISGANLGIPWNIIGIRHDDENVIYLNPKIYDCSPERVKTKSNCGSLRLPELIDVWRHEWISLEWYDLTGQKCRRKHIKAKNQGFTIQHECDHNVGITILDKQVK